LQFFVSYSAVIIGAFSAGPMFSFASDRGNAAKSARVSKYSLIVIHVLTLESRLVTLSVVRTCKYVLISRTSLLIIYPMLSNVSFSVLPGRHLALVSETGSGKSIAIALLKRFYNPTSDSILLDRKLISSVR